MNRFPKRIVCLTEETVETLHLLGCLDLVVGVSGFAVRPKGIRSKPRVSAFVSADVPKILELKPDLVMCFSDIQAEIAAELMRAGVEVMGFNQRTLAEVLRAIVLAGSLVGKSVEAEELANRLEDRVEAARHRAHGKPRVRVYFEEWDDPMISAIGWVSELIEAAGGQNVFAAKSLGRAAKERFVTSSDVIAANPELILGSWCGKKFKPERVMARQGWEDVVAVKTKRVFEVKSSIILQPGPAALTDGLDALERHITACRA